MEMGTLIKWLLIFFGLVAILALLGHLIGWINLNPAAGNTLDNMVYQ